MDIQDLQEKWPLLLENTLARSPIVKNLNITTGHRQSEVDGYAECLIDNEQHHLIIEYKESGQPRNVRLAASHLRRVLAGTPTPHLGIFIAPFISPASRALLAEEGLGWLDLAGNARISLPRLHLEITKTDHDPFATKRELRSLFYPKSARLLKKLLIHPGRSWWVAELQEEAQVSLGQVSNVRKALIDREWAVADKGGGLHLTQPEALLDAWRDSGINKPEVLMQGYTLLHGQNLQAALEAAYADAAKQSAKLLLAANSVARRMAPLLRTAGEFLYADQAGLDILKEKLQLQYAPQGANITVYKAADEGLWLEPQAIPFCAIAGTDRVQTYLDLLTGGERSREAAEHWRKEMISKPWSEQ